MVEEGEDCELVEEGEERVGRGGRRERELVEEGEERVGGGIDERREPGEM